MDADNLIKVAAGLITNTLNQILIAKRPKGVHFADHWEFPGGKIEEDESAEQALKRELEEELGIIIQEFNLFMTFTHDYPEKSVEFDIYKVTQFMGLPQAKQSQEIKWVAINDLNQYPFPGANRKIIQVLESDL